MEESPNTSVAITLWKYGGADIVPMATRVHSYIPPLVMNAVRCLEATPMGAWKNPDVKSMTTKNFGRLSPTLRSNIPMFGIGHLSTKGKK